MDKRKLLFITEGSVDEPKFIEKIFKKCYSFVEYEYYSYSTDIHTLARLLFDKDGHLDEYLDIKSVLKSNETVEDKRKILSKNYSDIILVFDFDPQSTETEFEKIHKMLKFFNDSTNNGKLYINYPMMQSYKHILTYPQEDITFKERKIEIKNCFNYKELVNRQSFCTDIRKYTFPIIMKIMGYQLKKTNYILNKKYELPSYNEFFCLDLLEVYNKQYKFLKSEGSIYVLNTFIFYLIEYNPKIILEKIKLHD